MAKQPGSVGSAALWMFVLSVLLFWAPLIGPFIAGFVGGRKAGTVGNAILAAILPGLLLGLALFFLASLFTGFPLFGVVAGAGGVTLAFAHIGPLLVGAILGALL
ncbi:MAG: hypothetical protein JOY62_06905 [Acidobacteriaceae bacterium]|nr:hypothetical protein [Acidobacteriaceae bacterium]MBV9779687.1 hypothetical protein [Acidobacteriaceae bacterium]